MSESTDNCLCNIYKFKEIFSMDSKTPFKVHLSAYYRRSFAFYTVKERMPVILTKLIDYLVRDREKIIKNYGENVGEELKIIIGQMSKLKYEIQTNKPMEKLHSTETDVNIYNSYLDELANVDGVPRYFSTVWLYVECYMYRRIKNMFENTALKDFDYYKDSKCLSFTNSLEAISGLANYFLTTLINNQGIDVHTELVKLLKFNLWGNKCDLSISSGSDNSQKIDPLSSLTTYEPFILCDHSEQIWEALNNSHNSSTINFINDNAGYEMFTDFCLADYLIEHKLAEKIIFNIKKIPWFISDMMESDVDWILENLKSCEDQNLVMLGHRWSDYLKNNSWEIEVNDFWTLPVDYSRMKAINEKLYERFSQSKLLIFKGDLNYRKLFGEINWDPTTSVEVALQGFKPTQLCTLRTLKADIIVGLEKGLAEKLDKIDDTWMISGEYGVIQFCGCK